MSTRARWLIAIATVAVAGVVWTWRLSVDPRVVMLRPSADGAGWLRLDRPFDVAAHHHEATAVSFAAQVDVPTGGGTIEVAALKRAVIWVDDRRLLDTGPRPATWKATVPVAIPAGHHVVRVAVSNDAGPSLVRVGGAGLRTGTGDWRASGDGGRSWAPAVPVDRPWEPPLEPVFVSTPRALLGYAPLWIVAAGVGAVALLRRPTGADWGRRVRWAVLVGWVVLAANDIHKVPLAVGYDVDSHYDYIHYVATHGALPPPEGAWQSFQTPLYYVVSAGLERLLTLAGVAAGTVPVALRIVPLACGLAVVELCYRAGRVVFPGRGDLQAMATVVGGLLPANLYMAQVVSNEPMAAAAGAAVAVLALHGLARPDRARSAPFLALLGATLGVAWLSKISTLLWCGPVGLAGVAVLWRSPWAERARAAAVVAAAALLVSGWYFAVTVARTGKPILAESPAARAGDWWQDSGYRVPSNLWSFGGCFARPVYNGLGSVWDSLYGSVWGNGIVAGRPPWNYGLMSAGLGLAVVPTGLMLAGVVGRRRVAAVRFSAVAVGLFVLAIVNVYLTLPIYSCGKGSYLLGTAPCLGVLAAAGFDTLRPWRRARAVVGGLVVSWAVVAYLTYFAV